MTDFEKIVEFCWKIARFSYNHRTDSSLYRKIYEGDGIIGLRITTAASLKNVDLLFFLLVDNTWATKL